MQAGPRLELADLSRVLDDAERWNAQGPSVDREGGFAAIHRLRATLQHLREAVESAERSSRCVP